jgi:hypothetical protein
VRRIGSRRLSGKEKVLQFVADRGWTEIGETEWEELLMALPDVSETIIRTAGIPLRAPWSGVPTHTIEQIDATLREFSAVYAARPDLRPYCRDQVIYAKDRARWASRNAKVDEHARAMKAEMVEWMLVWLDDPAVFPVWAQLRLDILNGKNAIH